MIALHRLNGHEVIVNAELIESVESHGVQTVIGLVTGNRIAVTEGVAEVIAKSLDYRKKVYVGASYLPEFLKRKEPEGGASCR